MERLESYRSLLADEYGRRKSARKSFSNSSFARFVGLSSSHLNDIQNNRRGLSEAKALDIADKLNLSEYEKDFFIFSVRAEHSRSRSEREISQKKLDELRKSPVKNLEMDAFNTRSNWVDFAILELIRFDDFDMDGSWIAKKLSVDEEVVEGSISRLKRLDMVRFENGRWKSHSGLLATKNDIPSQALKNYHQQILDLAKDAISNQGVDQRDSQSLTFAIDKKDLQNAKLDIRNFLVDFSKKYSNDVDEKNSVYCLTSQLFSLMEKDGDEG